ncbi:MAG: YidB family protein [Nitrospiraceae bacterium]
MGLFDQLAQAASLFSQGGEKNDQLLQAMTQLLGKDSNIGGLSGLIQAFQKSGLSEIVNSWVSTGANLPISAEQIKQGLGSQFLQQLSAGTGLSQEACSSQLSSLLPTLVDKLTPEGTVPESNFLEQGLSLLRGKLG